ncbi:hypothetical protein C8R46DRAFT_1073328 [Mycena filopes]|nr:hypothetical protein C8R46DRAFT_1073328 [Mycena filopes]
MPEDAQPNDLRGRNPAQAIPSIRRARNIPQSRIIPSQPNSFKRPSDRSYIASPAKRRRLDKPDRPIRKDIRRELPPACRKGAVGCHRERKEFIAHEIERLQKSVLGLKVISHTFVGGAVVFACTQADILNCSLASLNGIQPKQPEPEVDLPSEHPPPPSPIISAVVGPPRLFQSGTLSFSPGPRDVGRTSGTLETRSIDPTPVGETMFGRHGPTRPVAETDNSPAFARGFALAQSTPLPDRRTESVAVARASSPLDADVDGPKPVAEILGGKQGSTIPSSGLSQKRSTLVPTLVSGIFNPRPGPALGGFSSDLDDPVPVAEIMFGKQGPPKLLPSLAQTSSSIPCKNTALVSNPPPRSPKPAPVTIVSPLSLSKSPSHPTSLDPSLSDHAYQLDGDEFRIPFAQQHDKLRRFLSGSLPVVVSMYGAVEGVDVASRKHWLLAQATSPTKEAVDDACLLNDGNRSVVILAHGRDNQQLSLISVHRSDGVTGMPSAIDLKRPWNSARKGGVSAIASMMQPLMFASGGYDHCIHLWTVNDDLSSASSTALSIKHNSQVQSLLPIHDSSHKLVTAGADCSVNIWDLSSERVVHSLKTSNSVYQAHPTTSPFCTLLEIAHRELQFEVRDHRLKPTVPVQRFGYPTLQVHGRFMRGTVLSNCFASGDRAGCVRLWDLRNVEKPCTQIGCFDGHKIAHIVAHSSRLFVCSENNQIRSIKYV